MERGDGESVFTNKVSSMEMDILDFLSIQLHFSIIEYVIRSLISGENGAKMIASQ